jgi:glycosyltransferase involved in cell wall biosynthesis
MVIIIFSAETEKSILANMGAPEYSYYFVLKKFRAALYNLAHIVEVKNPEIEVDIIYEKCRLRREACLFFSFSPPHKTITGLQCPTISVFAWEYMTIPMDTWSENPRNDWRYVFHEHGCAITHSSFAVRAVQKAMGSDFPVWSIPAPVWDAYTKLYRRENISAQSKGFDLTFKGRLIDFKGCDAPSVSEESRKDFIEQRSSPPQDKKVSLHLQGIIYTSVFNPGDPRKNWEDLLKGFIWAFRKLEDVTLVLKIIYHDFEEARGTVTDEIFKLMPFKCRIVILHGYLNDHEYTKLIRATTYVVNTAHGEGQCLPLMEYMSAGKPAIAPAHTAMEDYISKDNAFVVQSSVERTHWPHDPRYALRTMRYRINWESLYHAYLESYQVAKNDPVRYSRMSKCAVESLKKYCSQAVVKERLKIVCREQGVPNEELLISIYKKIWHAALRSIHLWRTWCVSLFSRIRSFFRKAMIAGPRRLLTFFRNCYVWLKKSISKMGRLVEKNRQ